MNDVSDGIGDTTMPEEKAATSEGQIAVENVPIEKRTMHRRLYNWVFGKPPVHRRLYDWVLKWADTPYGTPALALLALTSASFLPVPPDVLLLPLTLSKPKRFLYYAAVCTFYSVLGGLIGYVIGYAFLELIGMRLLEFYGYVETFEHLKEQFLQYQFWAVFIAALTPIPYQVFTVTCGAVRMSLVVFAVASIAGRGLRFFWLATLIRLFGPPVKRLIDRYFNLATIMFVILLILGFVVVRYLA